MYWHNLDIIAGAWLTYSIGLHLSHWPSWNLSCRFWSPKTQTTSYSLTPFEGDYRYVFSTFYLVYIHIIQLCGFYPAGFDFFIPCHSASLISKPRRNSPAVFAEESKDWCRTLFLFISFDHRWLPPVWCLEKEITIYVGLRDTAELISLSAGEGYRCCKQYDTPGSLRHHLSHPIFSPQV